MRTRLLLAVGLLLPAAIEGQTADTTLRARAEQALRTRERFAELLADSTSSAAEVERVGADALLVGPADYRHSHAVAIRLADRGIALALAERFAREIPRQQTQHDALRTSIGELRPEEAYRERSMAYGAMWDAIGWIHFKQGRLDDAGVELQHALEAAPGFASALYHAGRIAEARGRGADAEQSYLRGYLAEQGSGTHDSEIALRRLIALRPAGASLEDVVGEYREKERAERDRLRTERQRAVLDSRLSAPRPMPPFRLATLLGDTVASESLSGKVLVVDFWGVWCGPCILELPHIQKLHERYRADPDVAILTINSGDDASRVRAFVAQRAYTLPVLLDDGYAARAGVSSYPTTWFVGKDGTIAFQAGDEHGGADLEEEWAWRIEALRKGN